MDAIVSELAEALCESGQGLIALPASRLAGLFDHPPQPKRRQGGRHRGALRWGDDDLKPVEAATPSGHADEAKERRNGPSFSGQISLKLSRVAAVLKELGRSVPWDSRTEKPATSPADTENRTKKQTPLELGEAECRRIVDSFVRTPSVLSCSTSSLAIHFQLSGDAFLRRFMFSDILGPKPRIPGSQTVNVVFPRFPGHRPLNLLDLRPVSAAIYLSKYLSSRLAYDVRTIALLETESMDVLDQNREICSQLGLQLEFVSQAEVLNLPQGQKFVLLHERGTKSTIWPLLLETHGANSAARVFVGKTKWTSGNPHLPPVAEVYRQLEDEALQIAADKQAVRDYGRNRAPDDEDGDDGADDATLAASIARAGLFFPFLANGIDEEAKISDFMFTLFPDEPDAESDEEAANPANLPENQTGASASSGVFIRYVSAKLATIVDAPPKVDVAGQDMVLPRELLPAFLHLSRAPLFLPANRQIPLFGSNVIPCPSAIAGHLYVLASLVSSTTYAVRVKDLQDDAVREGRRSGYIALATGIRHLCTLCGIGGTAEGRM